MDRTLSTSLLIGLFGFILLMTGAAYLPGSLSSMATGSASVHVADMNADSAPDVLTASKNPDEIAWYRNGDDEFSDRTVVLDNASSIKSVFSADLDNDGDPDILSTSTYTNKIAWYENTDGYGSFSDQQVIENEGARPISVFASDLDGDGDTDILYGSNGGDKVGWYENTDGQGSFSEEKVISTEVPGTQAVYAADLDGDGDKDAISASSSFGGENRIAWYRNTAGGFASQNVISRDLQGARSVFAADLDGDGDQDVLSASKEDGKIAWYENTSGYGSFSDQKIISEYAPNARSVCAADFDGDGDMDIVSAGNKLMWYENTDGQGTYSTEKVIRSSGKFETVFAADLDTDGDPDVLSVSRKGDQISWYSNDIKLGNGLSNPQPIVRQLAER
jgi:hypothetical protein